MSESIRLLTIEDYDALLDLWQRAGLHSLRPKGRDSREAIAGQLASGVAAVSYTHLTLPTKA